MKAQLLDNLGIHINVHNIPGYGELSTFRKRESSLASKFWRLCSHHSRAIYRREHRRLKNNFMIGILNETMRKGLETME